MFEIVLNSLCDVDRMLPEPIPIVRRHNERKGTKGLLVDAEKGIRVSGNSRQSELSSFERMKQADRP